MKNSSPFRATVSIAGIYIQQHALRREFWLSLLMAKILPILIPLLAWAAVFHSHGASELAGWSLLEITSYYLIVFVISTFTQIDFHRDMSRMVHDGRLNEWLVRPQSFFETIVGMISARVVLLLIPSILVSI